MSKYNESKGAESTLVSPDVLDKMLKDIKDRIDRAKKGFVIVESDCDIEVI